MNGHARSDRTTAAQDRASYERFVSAPDAYERFQKWQAEQARQAAAERATAGEPAFDNLPPGTAAYARELLKSAVVGAAPATHDPFHNLTPNVASFARELVLPKQ